jgi:23S rRNA (uracil1939-C5)-methyltransferase
MALCKYFGTCGGCALQHIAYETQVVQKVSEFQKIVGTIPIEVFESSPFGYRNRMDFIFSPTGLGLRRKGKWFSIVDIDSCPISNTKINEVLSELRSFFSNVDYFDVVKKTGTFRFAVVRTATSGVSISFVLNQDSTRLSEASEKIETYAKKTLVENICITYVPAVSDITISSEYYVVKGSDMLMQEYLGKKFHYSVQGFFQNNHEGAEQLHTYCRTLLEKFASKTTDFLDMYGGVGTFGVINSDLFKHVTTIESVQECINSAKRNIAENAISNADAYLLDAKNIHKLSLQKELVVLTDPPRSGMHPKAISRLLELHPKAILYISCNMKQLVKELPAFSGYEVRAAALFDLFPQTHHAEAVVLLEPRMSQ